MIKLDSHDIFAAFIGCVLLCIIGFCIGYDYGASRDSEPAKTHTERSR